MFSRKKGVGVIIQNQDNQYLLHLRDGNPKYMPNQWCLIGGSNEVGESLRKTEIREVKEETELDIFNLEYYTEIKLDTDWDIFIGNVNTKKQKVVIHEGKELKFFSRSEFLDMLNLLSYTNPYIECLKEYLSSR